MTHHYTDPFGPPWKLNWLRLILQWRGSILQFFWIEWIFSTGVCGLCLIGWFKSFEGTEIGGLPQDTQAFVAALSYVTTRFQAALSLMLGFYTSTIYNRWWNVRVCEGTVMGRINDLSVQIAGLIRDVPSDDQSSESAGIETDDNANAQDTVVDASLKESDLRSSSRHSETARKIDNVQESKRLSAAEVRMHLVRWLNLAHAIGVGELYEKQPNEFSSFEALVEMGLLTDAEYNYMMETKQSRYAAPFVWFLDLLQELKDQRGYDIKDSTFVIMTDNLTLIRGSIADLYMYRNVPIPVSYRQLVNVTVRLYLIMIAIVGGIAALEEESTRGNYSDLYVDTSVFWVLIPFSFEYLLFVGWLSVSDALGNPFRVWADEFEWENYVRNVCLSSNTFVSQSLAATPSMADLKKATSLLEQKRAKISAKWGSVQYDDDDINVGLREVTEGRRHSGLLKVRRNMTGY